MTQVSQSESLWVWGLGKSTRFWPMSSKFSWRISHRFGSAKYGMKNRTPSSELWPTITSISVQFVVSKNFLPFYQFSQTLKTDCSWNLQKMFWTVMFKSLPGKIKLFWNFYFEMFPIKTGYYCVIHFCKKNLKDSFWLRTTCIKLSSWHKFFRSSW